MCAESATKISVFFLSMFVQMLVYFWSYGSALVPRHFFFFLNVWGFIITAELHISVG